MDELAIETTVHVPPDEAFEFLVDFPGYAMYSDYLDRVDAIGDGGEGTEYEIAVSWWRLSYTARTEVTEIDPNNRIDWRVTKGPKARGAWSVKPRDGQETESTTVTLLIRYDAGSVDRDLVDLPRFVSVESVASRVKPLVKREAEQTVERVVADLEGEPRSVDLTIERRNTEDQT